MTFKFFKFICHKNINRDTINIVILRQRITSELINQLKIFTNRFEQRKAFTTLVNEWFATQTCSPRNNKSQIHAHIQISGLHSDPYLLTLLIKSSTLSSPAKNFTFAETLLRKSSFPPPPSAWNFLIRGYASSDSPTHAFLAFRNMLRRETTPNQLTFPFLVKCCASAKAVREGRQARGFVWKLGLERDVYVAINLVHFYGACRKGWDAVKVFDEMFVRSNASWNAVITACVDNLRVADAIGYFVRMRKSGVEPDETTMVVVVVLNACSEIGNLGLGIGVHSYVIARGLVLNCRVGTALVDMYAKSGDLRRARVVFNRMEGRNAWTWSAMILGLAQHGFARDAIELFWKMLLESTICPNYVTFLGVLCACSHAGLVEDGYRYFHEMEHVYGIAPMMVHYRVMVDILGRSGRLKEAYSFMKSMPFEPDPIVCRTLLSACSIHDVNDELGVGNKVREKLLKLEPNRSGNFVMVANFLAETGMWDKAAKLRKVMKEKQMKKRAGESSIELGGSIRKFFSGYDSQSEYEDIYQILDVLSLHMKLVDL